ncbi:alpha/beta hydrolase [Leptospira licerasiae]|uniref:Alpha/beta hydrolase family protein n=1 Tax=Leptospira licerasiae str. MMD4847 TaxID=1049971 RepID=A0ABN0HE91_9LEPT|nr:alpha/beta hydrolase [Leptospira licerasiae]EIE01063.1 alpha/beta hydrolase family protein [Leptospira licerasiae serovar Varillal str. VAR 010]EJZ43888.1 alpha/beta hydrolase family protein [Leptospira licerasiae str. MMD4847]
MINKPNKNKFLILTLLFGLISFFIVAHLLVVITLAPARVTIGNPPPGYEKIEFKSKSGGIIRGWFNNSSGKKGTIILLHGIRANRSAMLERSNFFVEHGYSTLLIDFQAHGESDGDLITVGVKESEDVKGAIHFVKEKRGQSKIGIIGSSLGGASALLADISKTIDIIIIESVFSTIDLAIRNRVAVSMAKPIAFLTPIAYYILKYEINIPESGLNPIDHIHEIKCPIFVISGKEDLYTFEYESLNMYQKAPTPKELWIIDKAAHIDLYSFAKMEYENRVLSFVERHMN